MGPHTMVVGDLIPYSYQHSGQSPRQKINKEMLEEYDIINQIDLADNYRPLHYNTIEFTFLAPQGTFSKTDCVLRNKVSLKRCKKIEIMSCILSDHHTLYLDINRRSNKTTYIFRETEYLTTG